MGYWSSFFFFGYDVANITIIIQTTKKNDKKFIKTRSIHVSITVL